MADTLTLGLSGEQHPTPGHICLIFDSDEQRRRVVSEYVAAGLGGGEVVRYFADRSPPEDVRAWVAGRGIDVPAVEARGALTITPSLAAYCAGGVHDPRAIVASLPKRYEAAHQAGYRGVRTCAEMSWVLSGCPGSDRFLEYEALLNTIETPYAHTGMCQYDARLFDGATLFRVLQLHPKMVAQGQIVQNPYYMLPHEFLGKS